MEKIKDAIKVLLGSAITASWFLGVYTHAVFFIPAAVSSVILAVAVLFWLVENWDNS